jgi:hypothetical protein
VRSDIADGRTGYKRTIKITVADSASSCAALGGALVDVWHCDAEGNYSEYGGTSMQSTNYTGVHFLRGRQTTNSASLVRKSCCANFRVYTVEAARGRALAGAPALAYPRRWQTCAQSA